MAKYTVNTSIKWKGKEVKLLAKQFKFKSIWDAGLAVQAQAVALCPVDFGRLRGSILLKTKDQTNFNDDSDKIKEEDKIDAPKEDGIAYVGTNVRYAEYQEFGSWKMQASPFMRPAFDIISGKTLALIKQNGKTIFADYLKI